MIRFSSSLKTLSLNSFNTNSYFNNTSIQGERVNATIIQGNLNGTVIQGDNDLIQRETNQVCIRNKLTRPVYKRTSGTYTGRNGQVPIQEELKCTIIQGDKNK